MLQQQYCNSILDLFVFMLYNLKSIYSKKEKDDVCNFTLRRQTILG